MKRVVCYLLFLVVFFVACKGPTGPPGPEGNANVKSQTFTIGNWIYYDPSYCGTISYSAITQAIVNSGAVLVYAQTTANSYSQLPLTFYPSSSYSSTLEVVTGLGYVHIWWTDSDLTTPATPPSMTFKVVVIASQTLLHTDTGIDWDNYNEVREAFDLSD